MSDAARKMLYTRMDEVSHLVERYPLYLPVIVAAEALHMKPEALRASIEQGRCPFGFCWKLGEIGSLKDSHPGVCGMDHPWHRHAYLSVAPYWRGRQALSTLLLERSQ